MKVEVASVLNPTTLYRFYDASNRLLYVGITERPAGRTKEHRRSACWWNHAIRSTLEHFPNRAEAMCAESKAILSENPLHNVVGRRMVADSCATTGGSRHMKWITMDPDLRDLAKAQAATEGRSLQYLVAKLLRGYLVNVSCAADDHPIQTDGLCICGEAVDPAMDEIGWFDEDERGE